MTKLVFFSIMVYSIVVVTSEEMSPTTSNTSMKPAMKGSTDCSNINSLPLFRKPIIEFTSLFLTDMMKTYPRQTILASPLASLYILTLFGIYSCGPTYREILDQLNMENKKQIRCAVLEMNSIIKSPPEGVKFSLPGSNIFGNIQYPFTDAFKRDMHNIIIGYAENVDFSNNSTVSYINNMVEKETYYQVTDIVGSEDNFSKETQLAVVTGLYFQSEFKVRFNRDNVTTCPFYVTPKDTVEVPFAYQREVYNYTDSRALEARVVEVPYKDIYTLLIIQPYCMTEINNVIEKLKNITLFDSVYDCLDETVIELIFPVVDRVNTSVDTKKMVQENLCVPSIFDSSTAKFRNAIQNNIPVSVSFGTQKFIYDGIFEGGPSPGISEEGLKCVEMKLDYPFIMYIMAQNIPIACGIRNFSL